MIFPISHERMTARRWPIVTTAFFVVCVVVQAILSIHEHSGSSSQDDGGARAVEYFATHPYLDVKPGVVPMLDDSAVKVAHMAASGVDAPDDATRASEQAELDGLVAAASRVAVDDPAHRFGYIPAAPKAWALFTYPFLHDGWLQLAGNLWFLVFCGMTLEDRWGRVVFPLFYVASGVAAALVQGLLHAHDTTPLVGASGAIAGCMGAFAVAFARTRVRFALLITFRPRMLTAPAYTVLPLWLGFEALLGWILPGDSSAYMAQVGGFAFGVVGALVLRWTGIDRKLDDSVERAAKLGGDPRIDEARLLLKQGDPELALAMLEGLAVEKPDSPHVHEAIAEAAHVVGDGAREEKARQRAKRLRTV